MRMVFIGVWTCLKTPEFELEFKPGENYPLFHDNRSIESSYYFASRLPVIAAVTALNPGIFRTFHVLITLTYNYLMFVCKSFAPSPFFP